MITSLPTVPNLPLKDGLKFGYPKLKPTVPLQGVLAGKDRQQGL